MVIVKEGIELSMEGLDLRLARTSEESMPLGKFNGVMKHVQLREWGLTSLAGPVLLYILHCCAPILNLCWFPVLLVQQVIMQIFEPACEDGV
jgi:hypothetical protein